MNKNLKSRLLAGRIEYQWRHILRLRKKAEKRFITTGGIDTASFLAAYRRLDRRCARVMALERMYTEPNCGLACELASITAVPV